MRSALLVALAFGWFSAASCEHEGQRAANVGPGEAEAIESFD
jgi:hypothetical protein